MEEQLYYMLQTCLDMCERLSAGIRTDKEELPRFLGGELLDTYREAEDRALALVRKAETQIGSLQRELRLTT